MVDEYPSNSHREKSPAATGRPTRQTPKAAPEPKKLEAIVTGKVTQRKKPLGRRFKDAFIGGDARGVWGYVTMEVMVPAAKDMIADATTQAVERMVFGESRRLGRGPIGSGHRNHTSYGSAWRSPSSRPPSPSERREVSARGRANHDFGEILLDSRGEAETVLDTLREIIDQYQMTSVADLYSLVDISPAYTDQNWGWTSLRDAQIRYIRGSYLLDLPKPEPLD